MRILPIFAKFVLEVVYFNRFKNSLKRLTTKYQQVGDRCGHRRFTNLDLDSIYGKRKRNLHPFQGILPYKILAEGKTMNARWFEQIERSIKRPKTDLLYPKLFGIYILFTVR